MYRTVLSQTSSFSGARGGGGGEKRKPASGPSHEAVSLAPAAAPVALARTERRASGPSQAVVEMLPWPIVRLGQMEPWVAPGCKRAGALTAPGSVALLQAASSAEDVPNALSRSRSSSHILASIFSCELARRVSSRSTAAAVTCASRCACSRPLVSSSANVL